MPFTLSGSGPLYRQVYASLREAILSGRLRAGDRLPVTRTLASDLGISRNVVLIAYEQLIAEGYAEGRVGAGTFVALSASPQRKPRASEPHAPRLSRYGRRVLMGLRVEYSGPEPCRFDFSYYRTTSEDFPSELWRRLLARRLRDLEGGYSRARGEAALRTQIAAYLRRARSVECTPERVLLVNGSQQALDLVARVLLDEGDSVVLEEPHYHGARQIFQSLGARLLPVPVDGQGLQVDKLPLSRGIRLAYFTPSHQFPTGAILPLERRLAALDWAARTGAYILEDDYDGEFNYEGRPVEAMQGLDRGGRVIYAGTFSRALFPSLRMGYLVFPEPLTEVLSRAKWIADQHTSFLQQAALADFMREGYFDRYIRRSRARNASRREALLRALAKHFGTAAEVHGAAAGVHVLLHFPHIPARLAPVIVQNAAQSGVRIYSAAPYYLQPPDRCEILLGYAALTEREIASGIRLLASIVDLAS